MVVAAGLALSAAAAAAQGPAPAAGDSLDVSGLPLIEVPAAAGVGDGRTLVVFISGDGGWAELDRGVAGRLAALGWGVVGINARAYLTSRHATPGMLARDVARVFRRYARDWRRDRFVLAGFSRGADLSPFALARLPVDVKERLALVALIGLAATVSFEFHWKDLIVSNPPPNGLRTLPELEKSRATGPPVVCVYGTEDKYDACRTAPAGLLHAVARPGSHHFDGDFAAVADLIAAQLPK
jgi:type IV secretory pathway VirJ component